MCIQVEITAALRLVTNDAFLEESCEDKVGRRVQQHLTLIRSSRIEEEIEALNGIEVSFGSSEISLRSY